MIRRKHSNSISLADALEEMIDMMNARNKVSKERILSNWPTIMGKTIAKYTEDITISKGILIIKIGPAPLKEELFHNRDKIKKLVNDFLNDSIIQQVIIK